MSFVVPKPVVVSAPVFDTKERIPCSQNFLCRSQLCGSYYRDGW